jgi:dihydroneopterin aldolase
MVTVFLQGLEAYCFHGVSDEEQAIGHRYSIDLEIECAARATETDSVEDTVDYASAGRIALETAQEGQYRTVERLAWVIGERILAGIPLADVVSVAVSKRLPPFAAVADAAGASVTVKRKN